VNKLETLWLDLTVAIKEGEPPAPFRQWCSMTYCSDLEQAEELVAAGPLSVDLVCLNLDYPDRRRLRLLRAIKTAQPSLPIVMLTVQHSEALAVWAFRSKLWDYLVKPVPKNEAERCLVGVSQALEYRDRQRQRNAATPPDKIPLEIPYLAKPDDCSLAPALHYVEHNFHTRMRSEDLATCCAMSPFRFSRLFKESYGLTPRNYVINFRLREAYRLLANPLAIVADVAFAVGFSDPSYFARIFRQRVGIAPSLIVGHGTRNSDEAAAIALPFIPAQE
jgi:AraC-like DNA-binding protein